jgi:hypothetical protein
LKRTRSHPTNMSTLVFWVNGIGFHKGRDNSLLNCWPWRASWFNCNNSLFIMFQRSLASA